MSTTKPLKTLGEDVWRSKMEKVSGELFVLTYGSIVTQLVRDFNQDYAKVNEHLEKMGYNIGTRLIEEFLAKSQMGRCRDFRETGEAIAKVGFKMFLNLVPTVANLSADGRSFSLVFDENPLAEFVELPDDAKRPAGTVVVAPSSSSATGGAAATAGGSAGAAATPLWFSNVLCGVVRGCLEMMQLQVEAYWVSDVLHGDDINEMRVTLIKVLEDEVPAGED
ncbi:hypothetical protein H9P43_005948 [Blastocladiella emersonii ATCC 22665]|nr:hypothetical protein H9P43_005948 [Blastocladiella emersonii ATCC 22665]